MLLIGEGIDRELAMYETMKGRMDEEMMSKKNQKNAASLIEQMMLMSTIASASA